MCHGLFVGDGRKKERWMIMDGELRRNCTPWLPLSSQRIPCPMQNPSQSLSRSTLRLCRRPRVASSPAPPRRLSPPPLRGLSSPLPPSPRWWPPALARWDAPLMAASAPRNQHLDRASRCVFAFRWLLPYMSRENRAPCGEFLDLDCDELWILGSFLKSYSEEAGSSYVDF